MSVGLWGGGAVPVLTLEAELGDLNPPSNNKTKKEVEFLDSGFECDAAMQNALSVFTVGWVTLPSRVRLRL